jgi:preprotein translocase subunit SecA
MVYEVAASIVEEYQPAKDYEGFSLECIKNFGIESPFNAQEFNNGKEEDTIQKLYDAAQQHYVEKAHLIAEQAFPVVKDVYQNPNNNFENIVTPFTDGIKAVQVIANLKKRQSQLV